MTAYIGVASAAHVRLGEAGGFMQLCHGKSAPLSRLGSGDRIFYYAPAETMGGNDRVMAFTAAGRVRQNPVYPVDMGNGFTPFRRDVDWERTKPAPIHPLLDKLDLTRGKKHWGAAFRFGLVRITDHDAEIILGAMIS